MSTRATRHDGQGTDAQQGWSTMLPLLLVLMVVFLSPVVYDLASWLRQIVVGG